MMQVTYQVGAYLLFLFHEMTRSISTPPLDEMLVHCRVNPKH